MKTFKRIRKFIRESLTLMLPKTRTCDYWVSLVRFVRAYKRFPKKPFQSFHDTLFHIKISQESLNPLRCFVTDKEFVKLYVKAKISDHYNIPTIAVLTSEKEALEFDYPKRCVIKPTHLSGAVIRRKAGESINSSMIQKWFAMNFYFLSREANYRYLTPKVIVEPFVFDSENPSDFKLFCVKGMPKMIQVDYDRQTNHKRCLLNCEWKLFPFSIGYAAGVPPPKPGNLTEMLHVASQLSSDFDFIRIDLYSDGKTVFVGEITNCHGSGLESFKPPEAETVVDRYLFA